MGSLELIKRHRANGRNDDVDRNVVVAQDAVGRAAALTRRMLAFSRRQDIEPIPTDVKTLLSGMDDLVRGIMGCGIAVDTRAAEAAWPILIDPSQFENALLNLCINARDAMPGGGRIVIDVDNTHVDDNDESLEPGDYLSVSVTDTGMGMTADVMARAFQPFFTTKPSGTGTGLGLAMIYGFARRADGSVRIESEVGSGTIVTILLPRHHERPDHGLPIDLDFDRRGNTVVDRN